MRFRASYDLFTNLTRDNLDVHVAPRKDDPRLYCQNTHVGGMLDCPTANLDGVLLGQKFTYIWHDRYFDSY